MDFTKYQTIVAEPPADAGRAASGASPLQGAIHEARKEGSWRGFLKVPTTVVGKKKRRSDGKEVEVRECDVLVEELKRAARQLEFGLQLRMKEHDDKKHADVYFKVGDKRKYEKREGNPDETTQSGETPANNDGKADASGDDKSKK